MKHISAKLQTLWDMIDSNSSKDDVKSQLNEIIEDVDKEEELDVQEMIDEDTGRAKSS